jgi:DNA mismatch endonuclease, patch repair protein
MADVLDAAARSRNMRAIRSTNTRPEIAVRRILHARGFRFRLHGKSLPGKPDIVLRRHRAVILVHGCFWHGHNCALFRLPATRTQFWSGKIARNHTNDIRTLRALHRAGWRTAVIWECALKGPDRLAPGRLAGRLVRWLGADSTSLVIRGRKAARR